MSRLRIVIPRICNNQRKILTGCANNRNVSGVPFGGPHLLRHDDRERARGREISYVRGKKTFIRDVDAMRDYLVTVYYAQ